MALPINKVTTEVLADYSHCVIWHLIQVGIRVVSYVCDEAEVEKSTQRLIRDTAAKFLQYTIENPRQNAENVLTTVPIMDS